MFEPEREGWSGKITFSYGREARSMSATTSPWLTERVISAARRGDPQAITTLLDGSHPYVRRLAHSLCSRPEDAEDAAQEALIILYRKIGTLRATAAFESWMFQIVRNECMRTTRPTFLGPTSILTDEPSAEDATLARLEFERIVDSIAGLPPEQRTVLVLRDIQGLAGTATAKALGISNPAMKSRLHRGREALRERLETSRDIACCP